MEGKWTTAFSDADRVLTPKQYFFRCCNERMRTEYATWWTLVRDSFRGHIPRVWAHLLEYDRVLTLAAAQSPPFVGFYEVVDREEEERPVIVLIMTFDAVNNSASVDLLCTERGFSRENPVLSGRLLAQCVANIDCIFRRIAPIYGYTMVLGKRRRFARLIGRISGQWRAYWPDFMLVGDGNRGTRCGVNIYDKVYE